MTPENTPKIIKLDHNKLLGYRIAGADIHGAKLGTKLGGKIGEKVGIKT